MKTYENPPPLEGRIYENGCSIEASNLKLKPIDKTSCWGSRCMFHARNDQSWEPRQLGIFHQLARSPAPGFNRVFFRGFSMPWQPWDLGGKSARLAIPSFSQEKHLEMKDIEGWQRYFLLWFLPLFATVAWSEKKPGQKTRCRKLENENGLNSGPFPRAPVNYWQVAFYWMSKISIYIYIYTYIPSGCWLQFHPLD